MKHKFLVVLAASLACVLAMPAKADIDCKLTYSITGWSIIYKHSSGSGTVHCNNGQAMHVKIAVKGVGLTAGKWRINDGRGVFSGVRKMSDILGNYGNAEAHAGAVKSVSSQVVTKGTVSLALAGHGEGVDLGVDVGQFTISR